TASKPSRALESIRPASGSQGTDWPEAGEEPRARRVTMWPFDVSKGSRSEPTRPVEPETRIFMARAPDGWAAWSIGRRSAVGFQLCLVEDETEFRGRCVPERKFGKKVDGSGDTKAAQEGDRGGDVGVGIVAGFALDDEPALVGDLFQQSEEAEPVDV